VAPHPSCPLTSNRLEITLVTVTAARPELAPTTADQAGRSGIRSAAVAASSGLALLVAAPAAVASPDVADLPKEQLAEKGALALTVTPTVAVPDTAQWSIPSIEVSGEKPAPPPAPVVRETQTASRSASRTAVGGQAAATAAAAPAAASAAPPSVAGNAVLEVAYRYLGVPYVWGGSTPAGFDCSGFTSYVYAQFGVSLPRGSTAQLSAGTRVSAAEARPGDLVGWPGHVGIYVGNGQYIGARQPGTPLKVGPIYHNNPIFVRVS
jgi:cell wall-associated NlpC family hydrolase